MSEEKDLEKVKRYFQEQESIFLNSCMAKAIEDYANSKVEEALKEANQVLNEFCEGCSRFKNKGCTLKSPKSCTFKRMRIALQFPRKELHDGKGDSERAQSRTSLNYRDDESPSQKEGT